jgi:hypothetical protein
MACRFIRWRSLARKARLGERHKVAHGAQPWDRGKHCSKPYRGDIRSYCGLSRLTALALYGVFPPGLTPWATLCRRERGWGGTP